MAFPYLLLPSKEILRTELGMSTSTMSKLNTGEEVTLSVLLRICDYLDCDIGDICEAMKTEIEEKKECTR